MSEPLIKIRQVSKTFAEFLAVDGIDLDIEEGAFVAVMGPSGCGKTTTLRMIAGLETPDRGSIHYRGSDVTYASPWDRQMPLVWQNLALFPFLNVIENVAFGLRMANVPKVERRKRAQQWLDRLGLAEFSRRNVTDLSGGQQQRVALARALVTEPRVLLLDEPLSALDSHLVVRMQAELITLQRQLGITFVYVTHSQSEAFAMADRVVIMDRGRIQQIGAPREIFRLPVNRFVAEFVGANNIIPGRVVELRGERAFVETELGMLSATCRFPLALHAEADIIVGADLIAAGPNGGFTETGKQIVSGRVMGEQFLGSSVTLHVDVGMQRPIKVQLPLHEFDRLGIGQGAAVSLSWEPGAALVLPATKQQPGD
jgi:spermidine/putrescine transport system ATP-binding protein